MCPASTPLVTSNNSSSLREKGPLAQAPNDIDIGISVVLPGSIGIGTGTEHQEDYRYRYILHALGTFARAHFGHIVSFLVRP